MNKKILFTLFLALVLFLSFSAIQASDVNITDSNSISSGDDMPIQIEDSSQLNDLVSNNSDVVSDNKDDASLNENGKNQTEFTSPTKNIYYKGFYNVTLIDSNTNSTLKNKTVNLIINNVVYNATTDSNGVASVNLNLKPGTYTAVAFFEGDDTHQTINLTSSVKVTSTIKASNLSKYYKGSTKYTASFFDSYGNVLANTNVTITVNGKSYTKKTNDKGVASLSISLKPGTYKVTSTDPITGHNVTTNFKILPTITSSNLKKVAGDSKKFTAKFYKSDGKPLANQYVEIKINGKSYSVKTNSNGVASLLLKELKAGTYKAICYNKDGFSKTHTITVYSIGTTKLTTKFYVLVPKDKKSIKVELSTNLNDDSNAGKVIRITINGQTYYRTTDSEGIAIFKCGFLPKGVYKVTYEYDGTKFFNPSKTTNYVTVLDTTKSKLTVKSTTKFGHGANTNLKVAFTAGGVPLIKKTVTLKMAGKTFTETTDLDGLISIPITFKIGSYTVKYTGKGTSKVNGTSGSFNIKVFKRDPSKLTWKSGTYFWDYSQYYRVLLTDSNGKAISGQLIEFTMGSETYTARTASSGYVSFSTYVPFGTYKIVVKFGGNNNVLRSSTYKYITVKLSKFGSGLNEKNAHGLSIYLRASRNCPVGNGQIKALVNSLTSGLTSNIDKAKAIFNYVRDYVSYDYYYNTHKAAVKTLNSKSGNCVDQAHLLVCMYRTVGFQARYVHGTCVFSDGVFGHVWTQVLIGNTWVVGDSINRNNALGKITNWNTNNYHIKAKYASLPF